MSCINPIIDAENINDSILVGPHESSTRIDRDSEFEVCSINFTCGITTPRIDGDVILGISTTLENLEVLNPICAPIGQPSTCVSRPNNVYCEDGGLALDHFSSQVDDDIGLPLEPDTTIGDAFQLLDNWLKTFIVSQPPAFCYEDRISCELPSVANPDFFAVEWALPPRRCLGILPVEVPLINNVLIDFVESSKNPNCDFVHEDTIHITAPAETERFEAYTDTPSGASNGIISVTRWRHFTVEPGVLYDMRVYGKNYNCDHEFNYLIQKDLCTLATGIPSAPLNLLCGSPTIETISLSWTKPLDHNDLFPGNNDTPNLEQYAIDYSSVSSVRYPDVVDNGVTNALTGNTNTTAVVGSLNPGTTYEFQVSAKNVLNSVGGVGGDGFGPESNLVYCTTLLPNPPNELSSIALHNTGSLTYSGGGCTLDGIHHYDNIYNFALLDKSDVSPDTNKIIRTQTVTNIRNNFVPGTVATDTSQINAYSGLANILTPGSASKTAFSILGNIATTNLDGFSHISQAGSQFLSSNNITALQITADGEFYSSPTDFQGFWKDWNGYSVAYDLGVTAEDTTSEFYSSSIREYQLLLEQDHLDDPSQPNVNTPSSLVFVIDDINVVPGITGCGISDLLGVTSDQIEYVTGIPTFSDDASFSFRFTQTNVAHKFIRADKKHANVALYLSDNTQVSQIVDIDQGDFGSSGTNTYYTAPGVTTAQNYYEISTTEHNLVNNILNEDPGDIQFNDYTISFDPGLASNVCDDDVKMRVSACNLFGVAPDDDCGYLNPTTGQMQQLRIDTCSTTCLNTIDDPFGDRGELVSSGTGEFPEVAFTNGDELIPSATHAVDVGITYNHELNLATDLPEQLVLLNGLWQNPDPVNYNDYFFPTGTIVPDMSGVVEDGEYRYVTFKYRRTPAQFDIGNESNPDPAVTRDKLRLTINDPTGLTIDLTKVDAANHRLYLKIDGYGDSGAPTYDGTVGDGDPNNYDTFWLDCTDVQASIGIINGIKSTNDPLFEGNGVACLSASTESTVKYRECQIPVVTNHTAIFYVRIGWPNDVDYNFACGIRLDIIKGDFENTPRPA